MCGIAGWLSVSEADPVSNDELDRMRESMIHRGPDGASTWIAPDRRVGLAFRRLAIIDLAANAMQPMASEDGAVRVVFNGEIYNHRALRRELEQRGHRFQTDHSDTEAIVHGYEEWGPDVVHHLEGMFAIGVWDAARQTLLLARDRIGIKPLYFTRTRSAILFASEIKALLANPRVTADVEPHALYHYLSFLTTPAPLTMFRGIFKMPAGHRMTVHADGTMHMERYWDVLPRWTQPWTPDVKDGEEAAIRRTRELFEAAVEKRLMSDVPFGVFLSGGVDSSAIVAAMARQIGQPVKTFTVGFSDHQHLNELEYARRIAELFKTDHHEVLISAREMQEYLPQLVYSQDEPIADWVCIPLYFVSRLVRSSGTIVVQVGEGSDEEFCGYDSYMAYLRLYHRYWRRFQRLPAPARYAAAALARWGSAVTGRGHMYTDIINRAAYDREHFWGGAMSFWEPMKKRLLNGGAWRIAPPDYVRGIVPDALVTLDTFDVVAQYLRQVDTEAPGADVLARMTYLEFKLRLPELLLMRVDKITMSTSIEARVPFLDHHLVGHAMSLPLTLKTRNGMAKYVLKKSLEGVLPDDVIYRRKKGFGAPMREWLRGAFGRAAEHTVMQSPLRGEALFDYQHIAEMFRRHRNGQDFALPLWTLYNLTAWFDRWVARSAAA